MNGQSLAEIAFWDLFSAALLPALLPTLVIVVFGVMILRRLPKRDSKQNAHQLERK